MFKFEDLKSANPTLTFEPVDVNGTTGALFTTDTIKEAARLLKEEHGFVQFIDGMGHDRNTRTMRFEVTYNLRNPKTFERVFLKIRCDENDPHVPSLVSLWSGANWCERETYDMYGVIFDGHPDLRRMFMPQEFIYFPLRKDFPLLGVPGSIPLPHHEDSDPRFNMPDRGE